MQAEAQYSALVTSVSTVDKNMAFRSPFKTFADLQSESDDDSEHEVREEKKPENLIMAPQSKGAALINALKKSKLCEDDDDPDEDDEDFKAEEEEEEEDDDGDDEVVKSEDERDDENASEEESEEGDSEEEEEEDDDDEEEEEEEEKPKKTPKKTEKKERKPAKKTTLKRQLYDDDFVFEEQVETAIKSFVQAHARGENKSSARQKNDANEIIEAFKKAFVKIGKKTAMHFLDALETCETYDIVPLKDNTFFVISKSKDVNAKNLREKVVPSVFKKTQYKPRFAATKNPDAVKFSFGGKSSMDENAFEKYKAMFQKHDAELKMNTLKPSAFLFETKKDVHRDDCKTIKITRNMLLEYRKYQSQREQFADVKKNSKELTFAEFQKYVDENPACDGVFLFRDGKRRKIFFEMEVSLGSVDVEAEVSFLVLAAEFLRFPEKIVADLQTLEGNKIEAFEKQCAARFQLLFKTCMRYCQAFSSVLEADAKSSG